jgi:hypothetical protein
MGCGVAAWRPAAGHRAVFPAFHCADIAARHRPALAAHHGVALAASSHTRRIASTILVGGEYHAMSLLKFYIEILLKAS